MEDVSDQIEITGDHSEEHWLVHKAELRAENLRLRRQVELYRCLMIWFSIELQSQQCIESS